MTQSNQGAECREDSNRPARDGRSAVNPEHGDNAKPREHHRGPPTMHLGDSHYQKDRVVDDARKVDEGPSFGTPGLPPRPDPDVEAAIERAPRAKADDIA